jgi:hypothetical protein
MLITQAFPSEFLKAADLQERQVPVVMDRVEIGKVGDDIKPVLYFQGKEKGLALNKTNANTIAASYGEETDDWIGRELILYPAMVDYQGRRVPAIRVKTPPSRQVRRELAPANGAGRHAQPTRPELNDEIPF